MHSTCPVYTIHLPEYRIAPDTDWLACGRKLDRLIETHFPGRRLALRAIGLADHPGKTLDELVTIIQQLGTDRYDPERAGLYYAREGLDDIHAGALLVTEDGLRAEKHVQMSPLAETLEIFYEGTLADRGYSIRLDLLLFYDLDQLAPVYDMPPESCYEFAFLHPDRKPEALVGLIRILR
jgi:hypothetical protein